MSPEMRAALAEVPDAMRFGESGILLVDGGREAFDLLSGACAQYSQERADDEQDALAFREGLAAVTGPRVQWRDNVGL